MTASIRSDGDPAASRANRVVVWSPEYLSYRWSADHPMNPTRLDLTMALSRSLGLLEGIEFLEPSAASDADLLRIHTPAYLAAVKDAGNSANNGVSGQDVPHGLGTEDNPVFPHMHEASAILAGGSLAAAQEIASGRTRRAVSIGGGMHHAMADWASGFCVYNDAAVAISWLLDNGYDRIAYIDVDAHHGDGVQHAFLGDPRVLTVSLHQHPATLWPNTGWSSEVGDGAAEGTAVNIPVLPGTVDALWLRAFHAVVPGALQPSARRSSSASAESTRTARTRSRISPSPSTVSAPRFWRCVTSPTATPRGGGWQSEAGDTDWCASCRGHGLT